MEDWMECIILSGLWTWRRYFLFCVCCFNGQLVSKVVWKLKEALQFSFVLRAQILQVRINLQVKLIIVRLTPALAAVYFFQVTVASKLISSPHFPENDVTDRLKTSCIKNWWQFFLYVQNYVYTGRFMVICFRVYYVTTIFR